MKQILDNVRKRRLMDRRINKTRNAIFTAFEALLTEKRYEQITVQDIIDRADIGRSTFYAHFETKDDLLKSTCRNMFDHIFEDHPSSESSHDFSAGADSLKDRLTHILYHLKDDRNWYERIFACESADLFWDYFKTQFLELIRRYGADKNAEQLSVPGNFYLNYYCSAFIEAVKWWFENGLKTSPEDMEQYFEKVTR